MMKKKVVNRTKLKQGALKTGAKVEVVEKKAPGKPQPPAPPVVDAGTKLLADKIESIGKANVMMLAALRDQISRIQLEAAQPPTEWIFDMVRDKNGNLKQIRASANTTKLNS